MNRPKHLLEITAFEFYRDCKVERIGKQKHFPQTMLLESHNNSETQQKLIRLRHKRQNRPKCEFMLNAQYSPNLENMDRGTALTDVHKAVITQLVQGDTSISEISRRTGNSRKAILNFLEPAIEEGDKKKVERPSQITATERRAVTRRPRRGLVPESNLVSMYCFNVRLRPR